MSERVGVSRRSSSSDRQELKMVLDGSHRASIPWRGHVSRPESNSRATATQASKQHSSLIRDDVFHIIKVLHSVENEAQETEGPDQPPGACE